MTRSTSAASNCMQPNRKFLVVVLSTTYDKMRQIQLQQMQAKIMCRYLHCIYNYIQTCRHVARMADYSLHMDYSNYYISKVLFSCCRLPGEKYCVSQNRQMSGWTDRHRKKIPFKTTSLIKTVTIRHYYRILFTHQITTHFLNSISIIGCADSFKKYIMLLLKIRQKNGYR